jgi:hypothetical protein
MTRAVAALVLHLLLAAALAALLGAGFGVATPLAGFGIERLVGARSVT